MAKSKWTKADIQTHNSGGIGGPQYPAVNIKVYAHWRKHPLPLSIGSSGPVGGPMTEHFTDPRFTHDWVEENLSEREIDSWWQDACEHNYEHAKGNAEEMLGVRGLKIFQAGRSGGWLIVDGLPDIPQWNVVLMGKWRKFEKFCKACAADVPYVFLNLVYHNVFLPKVVGQEEEAQSGK